MIGNWAKPAPTAVSCPLYAAPALRIGTIDPFNLEGATGAADLLRATLAAPPQHHVVVGDLEADPVGDLADRTL